MKGGETVDDLDRGSLPKLFLWVVAESTKADGEERRIDRKLYFANRTARIRHQCRKTTALKAATDV